MDIFDISKNYVQLQENIATLKLSLMDSQWQYEEFIRSQNFGLTDTEQKSKQMEEIQFLEKLLKTRQNQLDEVRNQFIDLATETGLEPIKKHEIQTKYGGYIQIWYDTFGNIYHTGPYSKDAIRPGV